jgi:hypothetical protein
MAWETGIFIRGWLAIGAIQCPNLYSDLEVLIKPSARNILHGRDSTNIRITGR